VSQPPDSESIELVLNLDDDEQIESLQRRAAKKLRVSVDELGPIEILKRSIDARHGKVRFRYLVRRQQEQEAAIGGRPLMATLGGSRVVIVGSGPAGLFCAYELARAGVSSLILERGKQVQPRRRDLKGLTKGAVVHGDSNYCFGEGGAGTYSDGKLYTRAHKRGDVRDIIEILVQHGAPPAILSDARPHIGSNKLPKVVTALREHLESVGVEFRFEAKVVGLETQGASVSGVVLAGGERIAADSVVMATGHSARDVFSFLDESGVAMEPKGFAIGVRIEHPQPAINAIQYGAAAGHPKLPAAPYKLVQDVEGRGVFSFCMCPGGWIVPASTETGQLVVNGMSLSKRDSPFANSGLVVSVQPEDWQAIGLDGPLGGITLQRRMEEAAWQAGGGGLVAPAIRVTDFVANKVSASLPKTSYVPGVVPADMDAVIDACGLPIAARLRRALDRFDGKMRGYISEQAIMVGVESRTSAPLRVLRDRETLESTSTPGLYPCGEGAGYAGGIVSAAMDGMRVARACCLRQAKHG
jgi:uncharacterized FAD-dependent dehydrogenase